jgi:hypothetical protein
MQVRHAGTNDLVFLVLEPNSFLFGPAFLAFGVFLGSNAPAPREAVRLALLLSGPVYPDYR